jgi:hypothetical protein
MKVAAPFLISREEFLATGASAKDFDQIDRFDGKPGDDKIDIGAYTARLEKDIACHGMNADKSFSDGVLGMRVASYGARAKGLPTADTFVRAEQEIEAARGRGFGRYPSCS